ncbi:Retrovirus-related Pol polyprotein from transposon TNT 1-94 [Sesamum angolense]|uniref:Retrovirus-related Pol polyprotein from transposon TNT 1-94 n=1 Tax=Sesamum angolense TaxID=2727404 RepID=A0AAE1WQB0_9LAMI|nr:Retrovirus-related Pol polyprotein from transposon TNT 1-94 [Sesamum angolense]
MIQDVRRSKISDIDSDKWLEFMKYKMDSMGSNQVRTLVDPPKDVRPVGCKCVYKRRLGADEEVTAFKASPSTASNELLEAGTRILMKSYGIFFHQNEHDPCVYKKISGSSVAYLVLYIDDILLIGDDVKMLGDIKAWLSTQFFMKDMGKASYILGIKIYTDRSRRMLGLPNPRTLRKS